MTGESDPKTPTRETAAPGTDTDGIDADGASDGARDATPDAEARRAERIAAAARRALAEAEARRARDAERAEAPREIGGRDGPDPARYGDWEKKGIAIDFS